MQIIESNTLSKLCDYSFGDHLSLLEPGYLKDSVFKMANAHNGEFLNVCHEIQGRPITLFIDNIRLYPRSVYVDTQTDAEWVRKMMMVNDLLTLCRLLPLHRFVIFTGHEDTPIDDQISLPPNVLGIHAVNAVYNNDRIHPFPYGLQRKLGDDNRLEIMRYNVEKDEHTEPQKLLYINCGIGRNEDRKPLENFETNDWVTTRFDKDSKFFPYEDYQLFLDEIKNHKFMVCPPGHGMDCHRNWESLYLRRVPVMKRHHYHEKLMQGFPVLWIDNWSDVTKELLESNDHLYQEVLQMDLKRLDLKEMFNNIMSKYK